MATPQSPLAIPSTIDTFVLNTSLADYSKTLADNAYNANVILRLLTPGKELIDGGVSIVRNLIEKQQNDGGFYLGASPLNNSQSNTLTQVEYKWQNLYEPITITRDEERSNSGVAHKILDLLGTKIMLSEKAIAKRLSRALSQPVGGAGNLLDLDTIIDSAGQCGSINPSVDSFWSATETASGAFVTQGLSDMGTAYYATSASSDEENPDLFLTTSTIFQKFENTILPLQRYTDTSMANRGITTLTFKGKTFTYGNDLIAGRIYGISTKNLYLCVDSATDFVTTDFIQSTNQTVKVAYILWRGNLITDNRRRLFKLTGAS